MINKKTHFHFMGIGGIGMSAIAKILRHEGYTVSGCDLDSENKTIHELKNLDCKIESEHNGLICNDSTIDVLVYSSDIKKTNTEIISAKNRGLNIIHRATLLAELMKRKFSIAISGSHGKTTTSSLIAHILIEAKKDPTIIVGGYLKNIKNNAKYGNSEFLVVEADESDRSFEILYPSHAVITNIDLEHLDTYTDINDIKNSFQNFINKLPFYGKAIVCADDPEIQSILPLNKLTITYGIENKADINAKNLELYSEHSTFDVYEKENFLGHVNLNLPGKHNVLNSLAAIAISQDLDIDFKDVISALKSFAGIERRFSFNGLYKNAEVFDDYGHHPNEIKNVLAVAKKRCKAKLNVIFQPHRFTRTQKLWNQFIEVFSGQIIDNLIITDIYPASEPELKDITSLNLVNDIKKINSNLNIFYIPLDKDFNNIIKKLDSFIESKDILLLLGAGKVNKIATKLIE